MGADMRKFAALEFEEKDGRVLVSIVCSPPDLDEEDLLMKTVNVLLEHYKDAGKSIGISMEVP